MMMALDLSTNGMREVVVVLPEGDDGTEMLDVVHESFSPSTLVVVKRAEDADSLAKILPFTKEQVVVDGKATVYVCEDRACKTQLIDSKELAALLAAKSSE